VNQINQKSKSIKTSSHIDESITRRILYVTIAIIETILGFRFVFKLAGANPANGIVAFLYNISDLLVSGFASIFSPSTYNGFETVSIFEPGTLIAMVVVALIALAIFKLMPVSSSIDRQTTEHINGTQQFNDQEDKS
jgi:hypothetical protein